MNEMRLDRNLPAIPANYTVSYPAPPPSDYDHEPAVPLNH